MSIKFAKKPLAIAVATGLLGGVSMAQASEVGLGVGSAGAAVEPVTYDGEITIAEERVAIGDYTLNMDSAANSGPNAGATEGRTIGTPIAFCSTIGLNPNDLITFTFSGATWNSSGAVLLVEEAEQPNLGGSEDFDGDTMTDAVLEAASDFSAAAVGDTSVTVRVNQNLTLGSGVCMLLAADNSCATAAGAVTDDTCAPTLLIPQGSTTDVTVSVGGEGGGSTIPALTTSNTLANIEPQFGLSVDVETDTVDVTANPTRTVFDGGTGDVASQTDYALTMGLDTSGLGDTIIEDTIILGTGDTASLTLESTTLGAVDVDDSNIDTPSDVMTTPTEGTTTLSVTEAGNLLDGDVGGAVLPAPNTVTEVGTYSGTDLTIEVTGTDAIDTREWEFSVDVDFEAEGSVTLGPETSHIWDQNGTILTFPFMTISDTISPSRFVVTNASDDDATFTVEILAPASNNNTGGATPTAGTVTTGTITAGTSYALQASEILASLSQGTRAAVRITVAAADNVISGAYQMVNPGGIQTVYVADKN